MTTWTDIETRLRRMLRDPDENVWTSAELMRYFNDAQIEIQQKAHVLERVETYRYPPFYTWTYLWDWEYAFTEGDRRKVLTPLETYSDTVMCFHWEAFYWGDSVTAASTGYRHTQVWEIDYGTSDDIVEMPLHYQFSRMKFAAFDEDVIEAITERELAREERTYRSRTGPPTHYWRPDGYHNRLVLWPRPSTVIWQDEPEPYEVLDAEGTGIWKDTEADDWTYCVDWEADNGHAPGSGSSKITEQATDPDDSTITYECMQAWEVTHLEGTEDWDDLGGAMAYAEGYLDTGDTGLVTDILEPEGALFCVFEPVPTELVDAADEPDFPGWLVKYVEHGTLERAYGADTDGFIPSLRDYWKMRKTIGLKMLERFKVSKLRDRDFRLRPEPAGPRSRLRLPEGYPAVYP